MAEMLIYMTFVLVLIMMNYVVKPSDIWNNYAIEA